MQTAPEATQVVMPEWIRLQDAPFSEQLYKDLRKPLLAQGLVEPTEEEAKELEAQANSPQAQQAAQMKQLIQEADLKQRMAEADIAVFEAKEKAAKAELATIEARLRTQTFDADVDQAEADVDKTESEIIKNTAQAKQALTPKESQRPTNGASK